MACNTLPREARRLSSLANYLPRLHVTSGNQRPRSRHESIELFKALNPRGWVQTPPLKRRFLVSEGFSTITILAFYSVFVQFEFNSRSNNRICKFTEAAFTVSLGRSPNQAHALTFEARVHTATLPLPHTKFPHPSQEIFTPGASRVKTFLKAVRACS